MADETTADDEQIVGDEGNTGYRSMDDILEGFPGGEEQQDTQDAPAVEPTPEPVAATPEPSAPEWMPAMQQGFQSLAAGLKESLEASLKPLFEGLKPAPAPAAPTDPFEAAVRSMLGGESVPDHLVKEHVQTLRQQAAWEAMQGRPGWDTPEAKQMLEQGMAKARQQRGQTEAQAAIMRELGGLKAKLAEYETKPQREQERAAERQDVEDYFTGAGEYAGKDPAMQRLKGLTEAVRGAGVADKFAAFLAGNAPDGDSNTRATAVFAQAMALQPLIDAVVQWARGGQAPAATPTPATGASRTVKPPTIGASDAPTGTSARPNNRYLPMDEMEDEFARFIEQ